MSSVDVYMTLLQMKRMGYFKYSDLILVGSVCYPKKEGNLEYFDALKRVFDKDILFNVPIGHVKPILTIINGSLGKISYRNNELSLEMEFLDENNS